jgi:hypothetical protein
VVGHINDAIKVTRFASQPFAQDTSIWALQMQPTDKIRGTSDLILTLTESTKVTRGRVSSAISASPQIQGW